MGNVKPSHRSAAIDMKGAATKSWSIYAHCGIFNHIWLHQLSNRQKRSTFMSATRLFSIMSYVMMIWSTPLTVLPYLWLFGCICVATSQYAIQYYNLNSPPYSSRTSSLFRIFIFIALEVRVFEIRNCIMRPPNTWHWFVLSDFLYLRRPSVFANTALVEEIKVSNFLNSTC